MSDMLGPVPIPDPPVIAAFPLRPEYGSGVDFTPPVAIHVFDEPGLKTEQRFLMGPGVRRFRVTRSRGLACEEYDQLKAHWVQGRGAYAQFPYTHYSPDGTSFTVTARYENPSITFDHLVGLLCNDPGITLFEVPTATPAYTAAKTVTRFPDAALNTALQDQVQQFIPLITLTPRATPASTYVQIGARAAPAPIYLSNQRCSVSGNLYLPRLLEWNGIAQSLSEASDSATFVMGNADDVFLSLANQINLYRASIQFSLFHVNTSTLVNFWAGYVRSWNVTSDGKFVLPTSDGVFELGIAYPWRTVSRSCWKVYKGRFCPSTSSFPDCPKSYDACVARGVPKSFGGVVANPSNVHVKDNSTGVFGFGRSSFNSVTVTNDSVYQRVVREVYTDEEMTIDCDVAAGRDEGDFYSALGIVSEGPIGGYKSDLIWHSLDGSPPHDPIHGGGWRGIVGNDPAGVYDFFDLDQAPWNTVPAGAAYSAGLAFAEIRRTDQAGLQLAPVADRAMKVTVTKGIGGWVWTAPGARSWQSGLSNCVWVAINVYLRGLGLRVIPGMESQIPASQMEQYFDVNAAIAAAAICDLMVDKLIGDGQEKQFPFRGVLKEQKPLKDWLQEILNCCLGYYTFANGKLWIGIRENSSATSSFTQDTILYQSLQATPVVPQFNWLNGEFGDEEFGGLTNAGWQLNTVSVYDIDAAGYAGSGDSPMYTQNTMSFVGVSNKSQAARIVTTRLREELGGVGPVEQLNARNLQFRTTLLAMAMQVGDIISLNSPRLPGSPGRCEGRVQKWQLNPDFSIDVTASATTDSMYDLDFGPKPDDVAVAPVIPEQLASPQGLVWMPNYVAPLFPDPLYPDPVERTFDLWQDYSISRDGIWETAIFIAGEMNVNQFLEPVQPRIVALSLIPNGNINGPTIIYVAVSQRDAAGNYSVTSNLSAIWVPDGATNQGIKIDMLPLADPKWTNWDLWAGTDRRSMAAQNKSPAGDGPMPQSWNMAGSLGTVTHMTQAMPSGSARRVRIGAKKVWIAGIAPVFVTDVTAPDQIFSDDFIGSADNWNNRYLSTLGDLSDGSAPLWNFTITGFDKTVGKIFVFPQAVLNEPSNDSVQPGDVLAVRAQAINAGPDYVEDPMFTNSVFQALYGSAGMEADSQVGRLCRILRGPGQGQVRRITSNTAIRLNVEPDWDVIPTSKSVFIVESADYSTFAETSELDAQRAGKDFEMRVLVPNLADTVAIVGGFLVDDQGQSTSEELAVFREIYIYGQPPGVRVVGPAPGPWQSLTTDQTLRADTSANDVTIQLLPNDAYQGRTLYVVNDNGPHNAIVKAVTGEFMFDGLTQVSVAPQETLRITGG